MSTTEETFLKPFLKLITITIIEAPKRIRDDNIQAGFQNWIFLNDVVEMTAKKEQTTIELNETNEIILEIRESSSLIFFPGFFDTIEKSSKVELIYLS
jgi:hypothetical protein